MVKSRLVAPFFRRKFMLCLKEETFIAMFDPNKLINCRSELLSKCIHRHVYELSNVHKPRPNPMPKKAKDQNKTKIIFFLYYLPLKKEGPSKHFFEVTISLLGIPCKQCGNIFRIFDNLLFLID